VRYEGERIVNETYTTVMGNIVGSVTRRELADGTAVANFRVASNERRWSRAQNGWADGDHLYISVTCWRRLAENVTASFVGGDPVIVHGRLYTRDYEKGGTRNWVTELEALAVGPDLTRCTAVVTRNPRAGQADGEADGEGAPAAPAPRSDSPAPVSLPVEAGVGA
jgi:single-strand DNA-binding protein